MYAGCLKSYVCIFVFWLPDIYQDETKHIIYLKMCTFVSIPHYPMYYVQYNTASIEQAIWTHWCRILQAVLETIFLLQLKCFITCEMNSFEMFLESCKQWEGRQCQIWDVGRVWNSFKFSALYCHWSGNTSMGSSVNMLKKHWLSSPNERKWYVFSTSLGSVRKSQSWFLSIFLNKFVDFLVWSNCKLLWHALETVGGCSGPNVCHYRLISSLHISQYLCPQCLHHTKSIITSEFSREFHFCASKTQ